jgi:putative Holliday junction resolvase
MCVGEGCEYNTVRAMSIDVGTRRIGLAISDVTRTLARPLLTIEVARADEILPRVLDEIRKAAAEEDSLSTIVVGLPVSLDGTANDQTSRVAEFVAALKQQTPIAVVTADERLSSVEAESRLASRTKNWRDRKKKLDAAAAAVILQDYLDGGSGGV